MRFTLGTWFGAEENVGLEIGGFMTERRSLIYNAFGAGGANPVIAIPAFQVVPANGLPIGETSQNSFGQPSRISAHLNARLWSMETNATALLWQSDRAEVIGFIGFRYLDLLENLSLSNTIDSGAPGSIIYLNDGFATRNQFYGGQIGARSAWTRGRWQVDAVAKVAFGPTHQVMNLTAESNVIAGGVPTFTD
jgi:hypothetical protein